MIRATFAGFSTALSSIRENQKRLDIVGQNLANMNTVGYTRQQLETYSINYTNPVSYYMNGSEIQVGFGVHMDKVSQIRDPYLDVQYRDQIPKSAYNDGMQTSLDALAMFLDESNISGIRQAFDDIQSTLTNMQDSPKVNSPIYESELQVRMRTLTNLLNDAARQLEAEELAEFQRLDGTNSSEQGAVQKVNELLQQIGDLNIQIKRNQVMGQPSLELMDERNVLLDELASFVPIEVTYSNERRNEKGWEDWPDDLHVDLLYKDTDGVTQRLRLIDGVNGGSGNNYGEVKLNGDANDPTAVSLSFRTVQGNADAEPAFVNDFKAGTDGTKHIGNTFSSGSVQASLDMLGQKGSGDVGDTVRGYQYYMNRLDILAQTFADTMNDCNTTDKVDGGAILEYGGQRDGAAKNISITSEWTSGKVHISTDGANANDTILEMLASMSATHTVLDDNAFADYMNHLSTILANDSRINQTALESNVTILNGIQDSRDSMSAVSLDEEAANMMTFQAAYNAASRLMTTLDEMLNTLINNTGVVGR